MGVRGEVFSVRCSGSGDNRSYFFNVKENRNGDLFLNIVESKKHGGSDFERHQIVVFAEDLQDFRGSLEKCVDFMRNPQQAGGSTNGRERGSREYGERGGERGGRGGSERGSERRYSGAGERGGERAGERGGRQFGGGNRDSRRGDNRGRDTRSDRAERERPAETGGNRKPGSADFAGPGGPRSGERPVRVFTRKPKGGDAKDNKPHKP
ncbi:MAG: PUR family DNA/RNA-binding protein [Spirochaeta sp.]|nr:PUR family DNA/RNA-binding protein [Spirochaeta sp.]